MSPSLARWFIKDTLPPHLIAAAHTTHCHTFVVAIERREPPRVEDRPRWTATITQRSNHDEGLDVALTTVSPPSAN